MRRILLPCLALAGALWSLPPTLAAFDYQTMYSGKLVNVELVDSVKFDWSEVDFGPKPVPAEGEKFAVVTVTLDKGKSIGLFDYTLADQPALAMALDDNAFSPNKWEQVENGVKHDVKLLYKVKNDVKFTLNMTYTMPSIKDSLTHFKIDIAPVLPPLPGDFAFGFLTTLTEPANLLEKLKADNKPQDADADHVNLNLERDDVRGLHAQGLKVSKVDGKYVWTPESFAAYRDGRLLGIWDVQTKALRGAVGDEAGDTLGGSAAPPTPTPEAAPAGTTPPETPATVAPPGTTPPAPAPAGITPATVKATTTPALATAAPATTAPAAPVPAKVDPPKPKKDPWGLN